MDGRQAIYQAENKLKWQKENGFIQSYTKEMVIDTAIQLLEMYSINE